MYTDMVLTLIFIVLLWIAIGLQVVASSIRALGRLFRMPSARRLAQLERTTMPFFVKVAAVKVVSYMAMQYVFKKIR